MSSNRIGVGRRLTAARLLGPTWAGTVAADGATHLWAMQESAASGVLLDSIGTAYGNYNSPSNTQSQQPSPFPGVTYCIYLNASASCDLQTPSVPLGAAFTVEWLIQWVTLKGAGVPNGLIQASSESNFMLRVSDVGLRAGQLNGNILSTAWPVLAAASDVAAGVPYHFAISYDGTTGKLYINGALINTVTVTGSVAAAGIAMPYDYNNTRDSNCDLGGLALTPAVLSAATIAQHSNLALGH